MENTACTIRTNLHKVGSYEIGKKSLSCYDDIPGIWTLENETIERKKKTKKLAKNWSNG